MCGIAGIYHLHKGQIDQHILSAMTDCISHRGPDDEGYVTFAMQDNRPTSHSGKDTQAELLPQLSPFPGQTPARGGFGFRRLSIQDLSVHGHQPMSTADGRWWIVFNGEIYNFVELREELKQDGFVFLSGTDTEVILAAYRQWGEACLYRFIGMWAFAIYDTKEDTLFCARDRYGIKPFYFACTQDVFYFGSELKQLLASPVSRELNHAMLRRSMKINALLAYGSETYFRSIHSLQAGHFLTVKSGCIKTHCYDQWDCSTFEASRLSFEDATQIYRELFTDSVKLQMRSDVPVGSCLSGGMDSTAIVCIATQLTGNDFHTFSSYYSEDKALDERKWIEIASRHCGTVSHLESPPAQKTIDWFEQATWYNDLPVGAGFVSQYAVMQSARKAGIKVLLDGQGSDEMTAGYRHAFYRYFADILRKGDVLRLSREFAAYAKGKKAGFALSALGKSLLSAVKSENSLYQIELEHYRFEPFTPDFAPHGDALSEIKDLPTGRLTNFLYNMMHTTSLQTLLHYEDRMAMAHGVESRVPFLDHRLVEFAFSLPSHYKIAPPLGKVIHRQALRPVLPEAIYNRKDKAVFGSPFYSVWLKDKLADYVNDIFSSSAFRERGIYNLPVIRQKWQNYRSGVQADGEMLFNLLALENWFRTFRI